MDEKFINIEDWIHRVMPQVVSCPRELALDALQSVAVEFFKETRVWVYKTCEELPANCKVLELSLPKNATIVAIESLRINNVNTTSGDYNLESDNSITFHSMMPQKCTVNIELILRPNRFSTLVPARLMEEYGDTIVFGALAKIKSMTGSEGTITWSDPESAKMNYELYTQGMNNAKLRAHIVRGFGLVKPTWN